MHPRETPSKAQQRFCEAIDSEAYASWSTQDSMSMSQFNEALPNIDENANFNVHREVASEAKMGSWMSNARASRRLLEARSKSGPSLAFSPSTDLLASGTFDG